MQYNNTHYPPLCTRRGCLVFTFRVLDTPLRSSSSTFKVILMIEPTKLPLYLLTCIIQLETILEAYRSKLLQLPKGIMGITTYTIIKTRIDKHPT